MGLFQQPVKSMNRHTLIAFSASLGMGVAFLNLTPVLPSLRLAYGVTNTQMGLLVTALILTHSLVQVPSGLVVDKIGVRTGVSLALGLGFLGSFFSIFSSHFGFLMAMRLLTGIGTGLSFVAGLHYGTAHAREGRKIQVQAIFGGLINVGSMIPFFTSSLLLRYDGRLIYLFTSLFFFLPMIAVLIWGKDPQKTEKISRTQVARVFRAKTTWTLGFCHAVFFGGMMAIGTWITSYLMTSRGGLMGLSWVGLLGGVIIGISAAGRFLGALTPSRVRPHTLISWALVLLVLSYGGLGVSQGLAPGLTLLGIAALMNSITFGPVFFLAYRYSPPSVAGTTVGMVNFIASIGAFLFPVIFGYFLDLTEMFKIPFFFLAALAFCSLLTVFTLSEKAGRPVSR
jgi:NNP family nitrate/nitrite transporter-like MFS transporter